MFFDETLAIKACDDEPSQIFKIIEEGHKELVEKILNKRNKEINLVNEQGDSILIVLLKHNWYDLVIRHMKNKDWNVNYQNNDGDTFAHIVVTKKYLDVMEILKGLIKNKRYIPNIRNKSGETILDKSVNNNHMYTTSKVIEDKRFTNIDLISFKNLYETFIKNDEYGKYSKLTNLEIIMGSLSKKELLPKMEKIVKQIFINYDKIKEQVLNNETKELDTLISASLIETK